MTVPANLIPILTILALVSATVAGSHLGLLLLEARTRQQQDGTPAAGAVADRMGAQLQARLGGNTFAFWPRWDLWLSLAGTPPRLHRVLGWGLLGGLVALALLLPLQALLGLLALPGVLCGLLLYYRSQMGLVRNRLTRELPDMLLILAAEMAANRNLGQVLMIYSDKPGPIAAFIRRVADEVAAGIEGEGLFAHDSETREGAIVQLARRFDHADLLNVMQMLNRIENEGAHAASSISILSKQHLTDRIELIEKRASTLENQLHGIVFVFFLIPLLGLLLVPILAPLLQSLGQMGR